MIITGGMRKREERL